MSDIIAEFEKRIAANKRELEEQERALAVLKRTMGIAASEQQFPSDIKEKTTDILNFDDLVGTIQKSKKKTLADEVKNIVSLFGSNEFTVTHVEAALKQRGIEIDAKNPRARIAIALGQIAEEGFVKRVFEGAGNVPHRYMLNQNGHDLA